MKSGEWNAPEYSGAWGGEDVAWFQLLFSPRPGNPQPADDSSLSETSIRTSAWEGVLLTAELISPFLGGFLIVVLIPATIAWLPGYTTWILTWRKVEEWPPLAWGRWDGRCMVYLSLSYTCLITPLRPAATPALNSCTKGEQCSYSCHCADPI